MIDQLRLHARAFKYRRKLDPGPIAALLRTVRPGDRCLDLGAHKGAYTHWLAKATGPRGRVVALEPQPDLADRLQKVMSGRPWVRVRWAGVSDTTGMGRLDIRGAGASHGASLTGLEGDVARTIDVPTITIADVMAEERLSGVDFVKIDVEGHELATLGAAEAVLREHRPTVLCECEARHHGGDADSVEELRRLFEPMGYRVTFFVGRELRPVDEFDASVHQNYGVGAYCNNFWLEPSG